MDLVKKAVEIINGFSSGKLEAAIKLLELLEGAGDDKLDEIVLGAWEATLEEEELTPEEKERMAQSEEEVKAGLGIKAEDIFAELEVAESAFSDWDNEEDAVYNDKK